MSQTHGHDMETASRYLRLALPHMSSHNVPVTPAHYAVWYDYVSGENPGLKTVIDDMLERGQAIDTDVCMELYERFIAAWDENRFEQARRSLVALVERLGGSAKNAGGEVSSYEASLAACATRLERELSPGELRTVVDDLAEKTVSMRETGVRFQHQLEQSHRESEALREELERARVEATTDALTGLANRKALDQALDEIGLEASVDTGDCLLMADIDHFKRVNDTYGHLLGDKVIKFVAKTMKSCVKGRDLVARFGGEEFAVLLPDTPLASALALAESIRVAIESGRLVRADTREPIGTITISIGVARHRHGEPGEALIARADEALYQAKNAGRNRVQAAEDLRPTGTGD